MTVGKTFVFEFLREHRYEIEVLRRRIKNARPKPVPKNLIWAIDLTGKVTLDAKTRIVLGILEHASRAAPYLEALESKSSWMLILKLLEAIKRYGKPRIVRMDNEAVFVSRLFASLKEKVDRLAVDSIEALNEALGEFRFYYNHVRSHQTLGARTPAEAWASVDPFARPATREYWFEAWDGLLRGYYLRR